MAAQPLPTYRAAIAKEINAGIATEHTYRPYLKTLIESLATDVTATNEPKRVKCGAPDYVVSRETNHGRMTIGHIEAKDVGTPLDTIPEIDQGQRYLRSLSNLIFTDYLDFRWYVDGVFRRSARLGSKDSSGKLVVQDGGPEAVAALLRDFISHKIEPISNPKVLAVRLARLTHIMRDIIVQAFEVGEANQEICNLRRAFSEVLIPDIGVTQFADMFAQTLAYGLFAARVNHPDSKGRFQRHTAAAEIPKTNPFLRSLFNAITGPDLDDEPFARFVDDLVQLLADTQMDLVLADFGKRSHQQDPVVHFYETYLGAYDPDLKEKRGVYYTPEPVVSYIVRSVDKLLKKPAFGCQHGLADTSTIPATPGPEGEVSEPSPRVLLLDPACGTGTFLYTVIDQIREEFMKRKDAGKWSGYVRDHLLPRVFGFELLMAPYSVAHLKLGMELAGQDLPVDQRADWIYNSATGPRLGVYLTNSLEEGLKKSDLLMGGYLSQEANEAAAIKRDRPIMVVLGNPPYSGESANVSWRMDPNPNKPGKMRKVPTWIGTLLKDYFKVDGMPLGERNPKWLQNDYVKFIRFGQWRIDMTGSGILAFITDNGYLDAATFRGMRQQLMDTFSDIYILDLHGNTRKGEHPPEGIADQNVFDIQQGVAIGVFIKEPGKSGPAKVHHCDLWGEREKDKYPWLLEHDIDATDWEDVTPKTPLYMFVPMSEELLDEYNRGWPLVDAMPVNNVGVVTGRDGLVLGLEASEVKSRIQDFVNPKNSDDAVKAKYLTKKDDLAVSDARAKIRGNTKWQQEITSFLYRPFDVRAIFYSDILVERDRRDVMHHLLDGPNVALLSTRQTKDKWDVLGTSIIPGHKSLSAYDITSTFPLYLYPVKARGHSTISSTDMMETEQRKLTKAGLAGTLNPSELDKRRADLSQQIQRFFPNSAYAKWPNFDLGFIADIADRLRLSFLTDGKGDLESTFGPEDIFNYIYGLFYSPSYRARYAGILEREFARIPLTSDPSLFKGLAAKGAELLNVHLFEAPVLNQPITHYPNPGDNKVEAGYPKHVAPEEPEPGTGEPLTEGRVYINNGKKRENKKPQYFEGISPEIWEYEVGGHQPCKEWLADRKGQPLSSADITTYEKIVVAISETMRLLDEIDAVIEEHGGWPL